MRGIILFSFFCWLTWQPYCIGQDLDLSISGQVLDKATRKPIFDATIRILPSGETTTTDSIGEFTFEKLSIGRYQLEIFYVGYYDLIISELDLRAGRSLNQVFYLENNTTLDEVVVRGAGNLSTPSPLGAYELSLEKTLRLPANFFDPARLATNFAGVATANDQANALVIRGQSPNQVAWRLQQLDIVNPNHTANAGTFGDRVTQAAGGVNILSAQLLDNSLFFKGFAPPGYGNALSGVMDMRLRKGNVQTTNRTLQVGLIGLEAALEGPISQKSKASYLFNYRYSTVGLLAQLGVDFGGEEINYQDLSFHLNFPTQKGNISFFGVGGASKNQFTPEVDSTLWELEEDFYERDFDSRMGAIGLNFDSRSGEKGWFQSGIALSGLSHDRMANSLSPAISTSRNVVDNRQQALISAFIQQQWALSKSIFKLGVRWNYQVDKVEYQAETQQVDRDVTQQLYQPYINFSTSLGGRTKLDLGLHTAYTPQGDYFQLEPRTSIAYFINSSQQLTLAYGQYSQLPQAVLFLATPNGNDVLPSRTQQWSISHQWAIQNDLRLHTELYYNRFQQLLFSSFGGVTYSSANLLDEVPDFIMATDGEARSMGVEMSLEKSFTENHYFLLSGSIFDSQFRDLDNTWQNTRFNHQYQLNTVYGKEWNKESKRQKLKTLGLNIRGLLRGGFWETPIDLRLSQDAGVTILEEGAIFSRQLPTFYRIDLRFYYRVNNQKGFNSTLSLDIQNLMNTQNEAYTYFDPLTGQVETKFQLGAIPIISYRIEF